MPKIRKFWISREEYEGGLAAQPAPSLNIDAGNVGGLTAGSIPFADAGGFLTEDNPNWFWDAAEKNLGIGTKVFGATMTQGIQIATGLAPTANVVDTFAFYSDDFVGGNACPHFRTENGTVIGLNQSLFTTDSPVFGTVKLSDLTDGYVPYHVDDATGLANSPIFTDGTNVGIGTTSPSRPLDVVIETAATTTRSIALAITRQTTNVSLDDGGAALEFCVEDDGGDIQEAAIIAGVLTNVTAGAVDSAIYFQTRKNSGAFSEQMRIDALGNVGTGIATFGANATKTSAWGTGVAPTTSLVDSFQMYSADVLGVAGKAGPHWRSEENGMYAWHGGAGTINSFTYQADVADDGSFTLPAITDAAWGFVQAGNNEEYALFTIDDDGDVTLMSNSANVVANADTDGKICLGTAGSQEGLVVKNRLGVQRNINLIIWYS